MKTFIIDNWQTISEILLGVLVVTLRLVPTSKNYDLITKVFRLLDNIIPNLKKHSDGTIGKHCIIWMIFLCPLFAFSQNNVTAKYIASFNSDSLTVQTGITGLVNMYDSVGALYYNRQASPAKWRVYESGSWHDLLGGGGGSGSVLYFKNGLSKQPDSTTVYLGGTLTGNINFNGGKTITNTGQFSSNYTGATGDLPGFNIARTLSGTNDSHGFNDDTNFTRASSSYASFNTNLLMGDGTAQAFPHFVSFQAAGRTAVNSTITNLYSFYSLPTIAGTVSNRYGFFVASPSVSGTLTTNYGIWLDNQTGGGTNYGIWQNGPTNKNVIMGQTAIGETPPDAKLHVYGAASTSATLAFHVQNHSGTELYRINDAGGVAYGGSYGSSGQVLSSTGSGAPPTWVNPPTNTFLSIGSPDFPNTASQTSSTLTGIGITGCATNKGIIIISESVGLTNSFITGNCTGSNLGSFTFHNYSSGAIDPAAMTITIVLVSP